MEDLSDLCGELDNQPEERKPINKRKLLLYESRAVLYGAVLIRGLAEMEPNAVIPNALAGLFNGGIFIAKVDFKLKSPKQTIYVGATTAIESLIFGRLVYDIGKAIERKYF